jgi:hypothetical protein
MPDTSGLVESVNHAYVDETSIMVATSNIAMAEMSLLFIE